jgi:hypothetical protein
MESDSNLDHIKSSITFGMELSKMVEDIELS